MKSSSHKNLGHRMPKPGCVAYLPIVEGNGAPKDFSKHGNDATLTGGTWRTAPDAASSLGYGIHLDGADDVLEIPHDPSLDTNGPLSIRLVIKAEFWGSGTLEHFLTKTESGNNPGWRITKSADESLDGPAANVYPVDDLNQNEIVEIVFATNSTKAWTFINGALMHDTAGNTVGTSDASVKIGSDWDKSEFTEMTVYSVEIYDRLLGVEEIQGQDAGWSQIGGINGQTRWFDDSWAEQMKMDPANNQLDLSSGGAHIYVNGSGEIVAVDEAGNETTLT